MKCLIHHCTNRSEESAGRYLEAHRTLPGFDTPYGPTMAAFGEHGWMCRSSWDDLNERHARMLAD